jgi:2-polyprenyl-3-methyl-5-hydroxy-6-metoxy-1,4-benzoquinol methylase
MQTILTKPDECILCKGTDLGFFLELKDHFLSKQSFSLLQCKSCGLMYTTPQPEINDIQDYYNSKDYTSHDTRDNSLKNYLYKIARKISLASKLKLISSYKNTGKLLDIGAGTGEFINYFHKHGWEISGIEPNEKAREQARNKYKLNVGNIDDLNGIAEGSLDVITMWHVLEHTFDPVKQMKLNFKLLKTDGLLVLALPNYGSWDAHHYKQYWAAYDVPRHLFHFSENAVNNIAKLTGFCVHDKKPLKFDAYYISLLSEKYKTGKTNYLKAGINGFRSNWAAYRRRSGYSGLIYVLRKN